jgi:hypothetical protein
VKPRTILILSSVLYAVSGATALYQIARASDLEDKQNTVLTNVANLTSALGGVIGGLGLYLQFKGKLI